MINGRRVEGWERKALGGREGDTTGWLIERQKTYGLFFFLFCGLYVRRRESKSVCLEGGCSDKEVEEAGKRREECRDKR
jgi:hypothetical protein